MQDPFAWSFPFGRLFGINIRIHFLFPFVAVAMILRAAFDEKALPGDWIDAAIVMGLLFFSVLLHEFGHCFAARSVNGDAQEVMLWPLGGLASCEVPHTPRAHLVTALGGPAVNLALGVLCMLVLWLGWSLQPHWTLRGYTPRYPDGLVYLTTWAGDLDRFSPYSLPVLLTHFFWVNYISFLLNIVLVGFPMDGGRILQSILWKYMGYRRAMLAAIYAGFATMFVVGLYSIVARDPLFVFLAFFIYFSCKQQWMILETGGEESLFGYDFSQGYTSLERDEPPHAAAPPKPKQSWWQRWKQKRAEKRAREAAEQREADERRLDELLDKVARQGIESLSEEERRFMQRVSTQYKNRNRN
jgi:stage IV sporulation protein FB